jgi:hypothetical protein
VGRNVFINIITHLNSAFKRTNTCTYVRIHENPDVLQEYHRLREKKTLQALYLQEWAERTFQMTASLPMLKLKRLMDHILQLNII